MDLKGNWTAAIEAQEGAPVETGEWIRVRAEFEINGTSESVKASATRRSLWLLAVERTGQHHGHEPGERRDVWGLFGKHAELDAWKAQHGRGLCQASEGPNENGK
jgi:hypothetical protein